MDLSAAMRRIAALKPVATEPPEALARRAAEEVARARGIPRGDPTTLALAASVAATPAVLVVLDIAAARRRSQGSGCFTVLRGPRRSGITCAGSWYLMRCYGSARRVTAAEVAAVPDNDWSENVETREELRDLRTLFLDDVGREPLRRDDRVLDLLVDRWFRGKTTLVGTHLNEDDFIQRYLQRGGGIDPRFTEVKDGQRDALNLGWWVPLEAIDPARLGELRTVSAPPNPRRV